MINTRTAIAVLCLAAMPMSHAGLVQFNFSGQWVTNVPDDGSTFVSTFSGSMLLDNSLPDLRPDPGNARYENAVVGGSMVIDGTNFDFLTTGNNAFVLNDSSTFNDLFAVNTFAQNASGNVIDVTFQLGDSSQSVFSSDAFPNAFSLADFDPWQVDNLNATGVFAFDVPGVGFFVQGGFDFAELVAVPVPATLWLVLPGIWLGWATRVRDR